jgi:hypothetical protein
MTLGAGFVQARHGEAAGSFHYIMAVGIVAIDAIHVALRHGVMLGQGEFSVDVDVALKAGARVFAGIDDHSTAAADADVFAAGAVAGFAAADLGEFNVVFVVAAMRAGREHARDVCVAIGAGSVADEVSAGDVGRGVDGAVECGTGNE